jgi:hypothetical protein
MTIGAFISKWRGVTGGAERANYGLFLTEFCTALGLPTPNPSAKGTLGDYVFEGPVDALSGKGRKSKNRIDLYKRGCFILEAKQSHVPQAQQGQPDLYDPAPTAPAAPSGARYDQYMRDALEQARGYATALPADHPWPLFLIVCDVGRAFELYFDWSGNGRGYDVFPNRQQYRISLEQLADDDAQKTLRALWLDPASIDPRKAAIDVTRHVSVQLAEVAKSLEEFQKYRVRDAAQAGLESQIIEETSLFLMRMLFCMFAEDVELLPKDSFKTFLASCMPEDKYSATAKLDRDKFANGLRDLWHNMGAPHLQSRYSWAVNSSVRYFNGGLFESQTSYPLSTNDLSKLIHAAGYSWRKVEPAIFGTLLEQALTAKERAKLGAHYTPRAYVERLVQATILDVLEADWAAVEAKGDKALKAAQAFHKKLKAIRVLDPACGTGNFLYVSMELLLRLEAKVIDLVAKLGGAAVPGIGPQNFFGLELNPRAAVIAELVLWIGWLRWRTANDPGSLPDPVLARTNSINFGGHNGYDAVLVRDTMGQVDVENPQAPKWPKADFIVGNPPFIGGKDLRDKLGGVYAEALWAANTDVPKSADFVMQWWARAADILTRDGSALKRFGFVTTNSITQEFSRRVIARYLHPSPGPAGHSLPQGERDDTNPSPNRHPGFEPGSQAAETIPQTPAPAPEIPAQGRDDEKAGQSGLSLILACADHPWTKASKDSAAVRIAMTVAQAGAHEGRLLEVVDEAALDSDTPQIKVAVMTGQINANLTVGANVTQLAALQANEGISSRGVALHGAGFIITPADAKMLGLGTREGLEKHIRPYRNGRDILQTSRNVMVIDLFGLDERQVRQQYHEVYQHLLATVKPERDKNRRATRKENWWLFGELAPAFREYTNSVSRYIATVETSKHRIFQFLDAAILPDNMLVAIGSDDAFHLGVLQSRVHLEWSANSGGTLEDRPRYNKSLCFDPFPFPLPTPAQRATIADLAEELDATRKQVLADVPKLTMTEIYNLRAAKVTDARAKAARIAIIAKLHDDLDAAVAAAYGWPADLAPSDIVTRLVALNTARAAEEATGTVHYLRPHYQKSRAKA